MGKKKQPPLIRKSGSNYIAARQILTAHQLHRDRAFTRQFMIDAAVLAAHRTFGAGPKRIQDFYADLHEVLMEMADLTLEDAESDKDLVYMKTKLDEALEPLLGENFRPYDERYGG
jgi:hypothetical protein